MLKTNTQVKELFSEVSRLKEDMPGIFKNIDLRLTKMENQINDNNANTEKSINNLSKKVDTGQFKTEQSSFKYFIIMILINVLSYVTLACLYFYGPKIGINIPKGPKSS